MSARVPARMLRPKEKQVQTRVKAVAAMLGFFISDFSQPRASMQTPGIPDLYLQHRKHRITCWMECKRPGEKLTPAQVEWHERERAAGGLVFTVESGNDAERILTPLLEPYR